MEISIDRNSSLPIYKQIRNQLREQIVSGHLPPGFRLPPERKLADRLGVNRTTILNAYRDLRADGLIDARIGQGTVVNQPETPSAITGRMDPSNVNSLPWRQLLSASATRMQQPLVGNILRSANRQQVISFAAGFSCATAEPLGELAETQQRILRDHGSATLQYSATEGHLPLRESLGALLEGRGSPATPDEVMVLAGSQQGIDLAARILIDPGDLVLVEEPTFFAALQIFQSAGARVIGIPIDHHGLRVDLLEPLLKRYKPKFIYTVPTFQNPSGTVLSINRRLQLLDLAYHYQIPIIEDDAYAELRYEGTPVPPLKALDRHGYVIYLSSFSKVMFPGLRVGWVSASRPLLRQFGLAKQLADLHTNTLGQWIMDDLLRRGVYHRQVQAVRKGNHASLTRMTEAFNRHCLKAIEWRAPEGGLYFWCRLPQDFDAAMLAAQAEARGVIIVPGSIFYPAGGGENEFRLSFASPAPDQIETGVKTLMQAAKTLLGQDSPQNQTMETPVEVRPIL